MLLSKNFVGRDMKKNILVTGGAGFIGSHIVDALIERKFNVIVLDNLVTGNKDFVNKEAQFVKGDIRNEKDLDKLFTKYKFHAVLHLAGQPSIVNSFTSPRLDAETNFLGTINMVTKSIEYKINRFLYASSMTVYGNPEKLPIKEDASCVPINYYGVAKYASERFVHITADRIDLKNKFNATSFRMFNVYGPRQSLTNPYQGVLAIFMGNVLRREKITIFGDGKQARDFVYVKDVARTWVEAIDNKKSFNTVINIGYGKRTHILPLARKVIRACGENPNKYPFKFMPDRPGNQKVVESDTALAKKLLNFKCNYTLQEGLNETLEWAMKYGKKN